MIDTARPSRRVVVPAPWRLAGTALLVAGALPATAQETASSPWSLGLLQTIQHDSNVYRVPDGVAGDILLNGAARSDWISTSGVVGGLDQTWGRERLKADVELDLNRFRYNHVLDSTTHSLRLEGDWATAADLSGQLGYTNSDQLYRYNLETNQAVTSRDVLHTQSGFAHFYLGTTTSWTLEAIFNGLDLTYSAAPYAPRDLQRWDGGLGVIYQRNPDLKLSVLGRHTDGRYPHFQPAADDFRRDDLSLAMTWVASGASTFKAQVSAANERHSQITSRSFHLWSADGQWIWQPTGRTALTLDFLRDDDTGTTESTLFVSSADARRRTALTALLSYELTGKIKLHASGGYIHRDLDASFAGLPDSALRGTDTLIDTALGLDYAATRSLQLGCNAALERRSTGGNPLPITYPYHATVYSCTGQLAFN